MYSNRVMLGSRNRRGRPRLVETRIIVSITIPPSLAESADAAAQKQNMSRSRWIENVMREKLAGQNAHGEKRDGIL